MRVLMFVLGIVMVVGGGAAALWADEFHAWRLRTYKKEPLPYFTPRFVELRGETAALGVFVVLAALLMR
jgi:hypothetical protein